VAALLTLADASRALSALFALDTHIERHLGWLREASEIVGGSDTPADEETRDADAMTNSRLESVRALRRDLAELAVDAERALPEGQAWNLDIVTERPQVPLPETLGPEQLVAVEASFSAGMVVHLSEAATSLVAIRDRLAYVEDEECRALAGRIEAFLESIADGA
jgi:hypothetical protein